MVLLDKPFVSDFLQKTLEKNSYPVIDTHLPADLVSTKALRLISEKEAVLLKKADDDLLIYSNSENSIAWIEKNLPFSTLPEKIRLFKNKVTFRERIRDMYPDYYFKGVPFAKLGNLDINKIPVPFIIKPAVGFFSMGVYKVDQREEWPETLKDIRKEVLENQQAYPKEVINTTDFIIEEMIEGDEFAIDCYFDNTGKPVILNIMQHIFSSGKDVSDRLYYTSKKVIRKNLKKMEVFLSEISKRTEVRNFPSHIEVRITKEGNIVPIEVNPMRFGGWCSSPDMAWYAFGINEYEYFFNRRKPDWDAILEKGNDKVYAIVILDNSTGIDGRDIAAFDYDKLLADFKHPLDIRKANYKEYPLFGLLFCETDNEESPEISRILRSDLRGYVKSRVLKN
jgi:hypothetical protein